jgi:RecA-family ATPase
MDPKSTLIDYSVYAEQVIPDVHEVEFQNYEYEQWAESPQAWSPLITLEQLKDRPDLKVEWYCPSWIPVGAKTIISAEPKCGKTILLFHILNAVVTGGAFLGEVCTPAKVLYLTEQTEHEFKRQVKEVPGLLGNPNFFVLLAEDTPAEIKTWDQMLTFVERMLAITKAKILVLDTFIGLAKLPPEGENDSATIQNNINKLNTLFKNRYLSVVFTHHNKKKSDDPKRQHDKPTLQWARGSSAFVGGAGHIVVMDDPDGGRDRDFYFFGRYLHGTAMRLKLLQEGRYTQNA